MGKSVLVRAMLLCAAIFVFSVGRACAGISLELVGQWGGPCRAAAVVGDRAYVGMGPNLAVVDISNKSQPALLGKLYLQRVVTAVAVSGSIAYVATEDRLLHVVDVSNPQSPSNVGQRSIPSLTYSIAVSGGYAYVAGGSSGLQIFDLSVPADPVLVGSYDTSGGCSDLAISGHYLYVADCSTGLQVIDVTNPADPVRVGGWASTDLAVGVAVSGQYAYVAEQSKGLRVINIADPTAPVMTGTYNTSGSAQRVAVSGGYAYVADGSAGLQVVDVSNPTYPFKAGGYETSVSTSNVTVSGGYAYATGYDNLGLLILDVGSPSQPTRAGVFSMGEGARRVVISGDYAYVADGSGLDVINVLDPCNPVRAGYCASGGVGWDMAITGKYACIAAETAGIRMVDISDPASPAYLGYWYHNPTGYVAASGKYVFTEDGTGYVNVLDISNPAQPVAVKNTYTGGYINRIILCGTRLYVAADTAGLQVIDVANPSSPKLLGGYNTAGMAYDVAVSGNYAYVADSGNGLVVLDVSNPAAPAYVTGLSSIGAASNMTQCGNYLFLAEYSGNLRILDISNPANPSLIATYPSFHVMKMTLCNNYLYSGSGDYGLEIYRINLANWGAISGRVTDTQGTPISGVVVSTDTGGYTATTGSDGCYVLPDVLPGTYRLTAAKAAWVSATGSATAAEGQTATLDLTLTSGGTISGFVKDSLGRPVGGVRVASYPYESQTDATGWYTMPGLATGIYSVTASKACWTSVTKTGIAVSDGRTVTSDFTLQLGTISGYVTYSGNLRLSGVTVSASSGGYKATTASDGTYTISNVTPDGYSLTASKDGWVRASKTVWVTGGSTAMCYLDLAPAGRISGFVKDSAGHAIAGAKVFASGCSNYTVVTDITGAYSMPNVQPYNLAYSVTASKNGYATSKKSVFVTAYESSTCSFTLQDAVVVSCIGACDLTGDPSRIAVSGNYAYVAAGSAGLEVVDVSNPANPVVVGGCDTSGTAYGVAISGDYAYVADGYAGLQAINISNPMNPVWVGGYDTDGIACDVIVSGNLAYVADGPSGLQIINVSQPTNPVRVGGYDTVGYSKGVALSGTYAYVADSQYGLQVIDISNPLSPISAGQYTAAGSAEDVALSGTSALLPYPGYGLRVVGVSNPAYPFLAGFYDTSDSASAVAVSGSYGYVGWSLAGLGVVDVTDPTAPSLVGAYGGCYALGIAVSGGRIYVTNSHQQLLILVFGGPQVRSVTPASCSNTGLVSITNLSGLAFKAGAVVRLTRSGETDIVASSVTVVDPTSITCSLNLSGAAPGYWDVVVTNPDGGSGTLAQGFAVTLPASAPKVGAVSSSCSYPIMSEATKSFRFVLWGKVTAIDSTSFWLDDGGSKTKAVIQGGYSGIVTGDYVSVCGTLDVSGSTPMLISSPSDIQMHD